MIGMVIIAPGSQGCGLGGRLMRAVRAVAGHRLLKLNSTTAGVALYESEGFRVDGIVHQHQGIAAPHRHTASSLATVRPGNADDLKVIWKFDRAASGFDRRDILHALAEHSTAMVAEEEGSLTGFAFCRPSGHGHVIGPIVARDEGAAIAVVEPFIAAYAGHILRIDMQDGGGAFPPFVEASGLRETDRATHMVRGVTQLVENPAAGRVFGLASQALG